VRSPTEKRCFPSATNRVLWRSAAPLALLAALLGCSEGPDALPMPSFNPSASAARAIDSYDADGDGFVAGNELENAPGLKAALKTLDQNEDGKVSKAEVAERVRIWGQMRIGMMSFDALFLLDGKPLAGAQITFDPEEFLGGVVMAGYGETSLGGDMRPSVPKEKRPAPNSPPGMQAGIYKVRVSKIVGGKETIPAKYNTKTILGQEVSKDDWAINNRRVVFKLKSD